MPSWQTYTFSHRAQAEVIDERWIHVVSSSSRRLPCSFCIVSPERHHPPVVKSPLRVSRPSPMPDRHRIVS
ncbi:hypothetical protein LZ30DRAFT_700157 [Colletotrichum cereale]|nr:hypothetical protein LZ30DRAFT_700157 [Colletotrichum cereale]